jgi:hypothetical protein
MPGVIASRARAMIASPRTLLYVMRIPSQYFMTDVTDLDEAKGKLGVRHFFPRRERERTVTTTQVIEICHLAFKLTLPPVARMPDQRH